MTYHEKLIEELARTETAPPADAWQALIERGISPSELALFCRSADIDQFKPICLVYCGTVVGRISSCKVFASCDSATGMIVIDVETLYHFLCENEG
jgi:hypothetical protein